MGIGVPEVSQSQLRFAVRSDDGRRSGIWKIWSQGKCGDVYVLCREMKGDFKISLHASGQCQGSFTQEYERKPHEYGAWRTGDRHIERWAIQRPVRRAVLSARILFPVTELRHLDERPPLRGKPVEWLKAPSGDKVVVVEVVLAFGSQLSITDDCRRTVGGWELANGESAWVVHRVDVTPDSIKAAIAEYRSSAPLWLKLDKRADWDASHSQGRILIFGPNVDGWCSFIDAASAPLEVQDPSPAGPA